jgi:hypothetical protein
MPTTQFQGSNSAKRLHHAPLHLFGGEAHVNRSKGYIFLHCGHEELIVSILKDYAYMTVQFGGGTTRHIDAAHRYCPRCWQQKGIGQQQNGGLPHSIVAGQGHLLACGHAETDVAQCFVAVGIDETDIIEN